MYINHLQPDLVEADDFESFVDQLDRVPFFEQNGESCFLTAFCNAMAVADGDIDDETFTKIYNETTKLYTKRINLFFKRNENYKILNEYILLTIFTDGTSARQKKIGKKCEFEFGHIIDKLYKDDYIIEWSKIKPKVDWIKKNWIKKLIFEAQFDGGQASESVAKLNKFKNVKNNFDIKVEYRASKKNFKEIQKLSNSELLKEKLQDSVLITSCMNYMIKYSNETNYFFKDSMATYISGHTITCFGFVKIDKVNYFVFLDSNNRKEDNEDPCYKKNQFYSTKSLGTSKKCVQNIVFLREDQVLDLPKIVNEDTTEDDYLKISNYKKDPTNNMINVYEIISVKKKEDMSSLLSKMSLRLKLKF